jgi:hypothetical protein
MIVCPFCHYENEDGALFCERCSSDLSGVTSTSVPAAVAAEPPPLPSPLFPEPMPAEPLPVSEPLQFAEPLAPATQAGMPQNFASTSSFAGQPPLPDLQLSSAFATPDPAVPQPVAESSAPPTPPAPPASAPPSSSAPAASASAAANVTPPAVTSPMKTPAILPLNTIPPGAQPRLLVLRGQKRNVEYPLYEGLNYIGRADEKPVDIDLEEQEPPDRIWCSRQHAVITFEGDRLTIEDLNSANGTYVNRARVYPGQQKPLAVNDIVQIGNVQLKVII